MAISAMSRSIWVTGAVVLISLWFLLQASSLSNKRSPIRESLIPSFQNDESTSGEVKDIKVGADIFGPGDAIPASAWENGTPASLKGAPDNDLYEAGHAEKKPGKPAKERPPPQDCPVCPEMSELAKTQSPEHTAMKTKTEDRPLILYAYYESDFGRQNLQFFIDHGLHAAADFVFIINGPSDVDETIIFQKDNEMPSSKHDRSNIMVKKRDNSCFDLGAHAEVLNGVMGGDGWIGESGPMASPDDPPESGNAPKDNRALKDRYKRYILMNASIRGPFVPLWSRSCWSDAYLDKVTEKIKIVGMSYNCHTDRGHVQSMIWATDSVGLGVILTPGGIDECFANMPAAQNGEIRTTQLLRDEGYDVDVFLSVYHSKDRETKQRLLAESNTKVKDDLMATAKNIKVPSLEVDSLSLAVPGDFWKSCTEEDWLGPGAYFGTFVHPYENLFMKSHRHIEDTMLDRLTEWHDGWGYSSYDVCF